VITGFNTDIKFEGVTYHVQTEDKGLDSPLILSLVYVGGAIIASKRTSYDELIASGYDEKVLTERLQRQHKLICAAIRSGRIEELKRMGAQNGAAESQPVSTKESAQVETAKTTGGQKKKSDSVAVVEPDITVEEKIEAVSKGETDAQAEGGIEILTTMMDEVSALWDRSNTLPKAFYQPTRIAPLIHEELQIEDEQSADSTEKQEEFNELPQDSPDELYLSLLDDEGDFRAGQLATIKVHVGRGTYGRKPVTNASVTVKVLGTTFRPLIQIAETDERGIAVVRVALPRFNSGRAAIIIRAVEGDEAVEVRRIIHQ
jgi:hypothetical protein